MVITVSKAGWDGLSDREQKVVRYVIEHLQLGKPAIYIDGVDARHYTFSDSRMDLLDFAAIGCFVANRADLPGGYTIPLDGEGEVDKVQLRSDIVAWLTDGSRTTPFVHPNNVTASDEDIGVTAQDVLDANGAPGAVTASIDPAWVSYDPELHGAV